MYLSTAPTGTGNVTRDLSTGSLTRPGQASLLLLEGCCGRDSFVVEGKKQGISSHFIDLGLGRGIFVGWNCAHRISLAQVQAERIRAGFLLRRTRPQVSGN